MNFFKSFFGGDEKEEVQEDSNNNGVGEQAVPTSSEPSEPSEPSESSIAPDSSGDSSTPSDATTSPSKDEHDNGHPSGGNEDGACEFCEIPSTTKE
jgi:hypothetical protein